MNEQAVHELKLTPGLLSSDSLQGAIDRILPYHPVFKIQFDDSYILNMIQLKCKDQIPRNGVVEVRTKKEKVVKYYGEGLYVVDNIKTVPPYIERLQYLWPGQDMLLQAPQGLTKSCMDAAVLTSLMEYQEWTWTNAECQYSIFEKFDESSNFPFAWNFKSIHTDQIKYSPKMFYQGSNAINPLTVSPFELPKLSILLPGSSPKFWRIFPTTEQIRLNEFLKYHREWKCKSPLVHGKFLIDNERIEALKIKSFITVQQPSEIMVLGPGCCYQTFAENPTIFEDCYFFTNKVVAASLERDRCNCVTVINKMIREEHKNVQLLTSCVSVMNKEAFHGKTTSPALQKLETKLNERFEEVSNVDDIVVIAEIKTNNAVGADVNDDEEIQDLEATPNSKRTPSGLVRGKRIQLCTGVVQTLKKRKADQTYYKKLSPTKKKAKTARDDGRVRECSKVANMFKREIEKAHKRLIGIFSDLAAHNDPSVINKPNRSIEALENQRMVDEGIKEDLIKDRERYNILKQIYCKSRGTLKANFLAGLTTDEVIRLFFDHTLRTNKDIWELAVGLVVKDEERQEFYKNLIKDEYEWRKFFNVRHGFNLPWKKWMLDMEDSQKLKNITDSLQKEHTESDMGSTEEESDNEDVAEADDLLDSNNNEQNIAVIESKQPSQNVVIDYFQSVDPPIQNVLIEPENRREDVVVADVNMEIGKLPVESRQSKQSYDSFFDDDFDEMFSTTNKASTSVTKEALPSSLAVDRIEIDNSNASLQSEDRDKIVNSENNNVEIAAVIPILSQPVINNNNDNPFNFSFILDSSEETENTNMQQIPQHQQQYLEQDGISLNENDDTSDKSDDEEISSTSSSASSEDELEDDFELDNEKEFTCLHLKLMESGERLGLKTGDDNEIMLLKTGSAMSVESVNEYFQMIGNRSNEEDWGVKCLTGTVTWAEDENVCMPLLNIADLSDYHYFMSPICMGEHCILFIVDFVKFKCSLYDTTVYALSQMRGLVDTLKSNIQRFFRLQNIELDYKKFEEKRVFTDGFNMDAAESSIFVCSFAEQLSRGKDNVYWIDESFLRKRMMCEFYTKSLFHSKI